MSDARALLSLAVVALSVAAYALVGAAAAPRTASLAEVAGARYTRLPPSAPLRFEPSIAPGDRRAVLDAIASARPEARRLIALVSGLVTIRVGRPGPQIAGQTRSTDDGYDVVLDLGSVYRASGLRGVRRLTLHELAHVVDDAVVPGALERELDAATPAGYGCEQGNRGGCAERAERFAESFAKWASGDIGTALYLGYSVPPPLDLSRWGAPLAALTRARAAAKMPATAASM